MVSFFVICWSKIYEALTLQNTYYCFAILGLGFALFHYIAFMKDRSLGNMLHLSESLEKAFNRIDGTPSSGSISKTLNDFTTYCYAHNNRVLSKRMKKLHQYSVAKALEDMCNDHDCSKVIRNVLNSGQNFDTLVRFARKNSNLFDNDDFVILQLTTAT